MIPKSGYRFPACAKPSKGVATFVLRFGARRQVGKDHAQTTTKAKWCFNPIAFRFRLAWHNLKLPRRKFLHLAAGAATLPSLSLVASADDYPTRPVKIVVGFAAGGAVDIVARLIAQWLSERIGQQCVVENRPGAGNNIATEYVLKSEPDGYTLLLTNPTNAINATYYENLPYNFIRDSAPVASIMRVPNVMEVSPLLSAKTVPEFIELVKANPGKLAYATGGNGTSVHMSAELFKLMTSTDILNVTYRGLALAYTDLMMNRVQVTFDNLPGSIGFI